MAWRFSIPGFHGGLNCVACPRCSRSLALTPMQAGDGGKVLRDGGVLPGADDRHCLQARRLRGSVVLCHDPARVPRDRMSMARASRLMLLRRLEKAVRWWGLAHERWMIAAACGGCTRRVARIGANIVDGRDFDTINITSVSVTKKRMARQRNQNPVALPYRRHCLSCIWRWQLLPFPSHTDDTSVQSGRAFVAPTPKPVAAICAPARCRFSKACSGVSGQRRNAMGSG